MRPQHLRPVLSGLLALMLSTIVLGFPAHAATKPAPGFYVYCYYSEVAPGGSVPCISDAYDTTGHDPAPTGAITLTVPSTKGTVTPSSCAGNHCSFSYTPTGAGSTSRKDTITGTYSGDAFWAPAKATVVVAVPTRVHATFYVQCDPYSTRPGDPTDCTMWIYPGNGGSVQPTGPVVISVPSYKGSLSTTSCNAAVQTCSFTYTPKGSGSPSRKDAITASYLGDSIWPAAKATATVSVPVKVVPYLSVSCYPDNTSPGVAVSCGAYIAGLSTSDPTPTGTVALTIASSKGTYSPSTCNAATTYCTFTYTPTGVGSAYRKDTITASYPGDGFYGATKATYVVKVHS